MLLDFFFGILNPQNTILWIRIKHHYQILQWRHNKKRKTPLYLSNSCHVLSSKILPWDSVVFITVDKVEQSPTQVCFSSPSIGHWWENLRNPTITWWQPRVLNLVPVSPQDPEQGLQDCQDSNWVCIFTKVSTW